jgi:hypothetical protein
MTLYAYDGASAFDLAAAKRHGAVLITGYIVGHPGGFNPIDQQRIRQIHALGMGFLPNWERGAAYLVNCSKADGVAAGREALAALRALGVPDDGTVACPFSWDVSIDPSRYAHCGDVADGIIAGLAGHYLFSAYGQGGLIDYLARTGRLQAEGWLSASTSFPGYDAASPRVALVQRIGSPVAGTDQDLVTDPANVHAWWPANSPYAQGGTVSAQDVIDALKSAEGQQLLQRAVTSAPLTNSYGGKVSVATVLSAVDQHANDISAKVSAVAAVVNAVAPRVAAQLQAAVAKLEPAAQVAVDVGRHRSRDRRRRHGPGEGHRLEGERLMATHAVETKRPQPLLTRAHVTGAIHALGAELVTLGVLTPAVEGQVETRVLVAINIAAPILGYLGPIITALVSRKHVTPTSSPRDNAGNELVPAGSTADTDAAAAAALAVTEATYPSAPAGAAADPPSAP